MGSFGGASPSVGGWNLWGYRTSDPWLDLPKLRTRDPETKISWKGEKFRDRALVLTSMGPIWETGGIPVVRPQPDHKDPITAAHGVVKRFCCRTPTPVQSETQKLMRFVDEWIEANLAPLELADVYSYEQWRDSTTFPAWRKAELDLAKEELDEKGLLQKDYKVKSFIKREQYPEYKYARAINSRSDIFKVFCAPLFKSIEKKLFALDWFIKKIPVQDRPSYIMNRVCRHMAKYLSTDYTSFEALFTPELMFRVEMRLYKYMTSGVPGGKEWYKKISKILTGKNNCWFRDFIVKTRGRRMSGEMCTSLGNSFSNLMFMLYVCSKLGCDVTGVVEGDDGLFSVVAGPNGVYPSEKDFEALGLVIKLEQHDQVETASFCGLIFDAEDLVNIREPLMVLADFAWTDGEYSDMSSRKKLAMLRCKALSLAHQYPGCPVISELAQYGLRVTKSIDVRSYLEKSRSLGSYRREELHGMFFDAAGKMKKIPHRAVPFRTRILMQDKFGITVAQQQEIEDTLRDKVDLSPIDIPSVLPPLVWLENGARYASQLPRALFKLADLKTRDQCTETLVSFD